MGQRIKVGIFSPYPEFGTLVKEISSSFDLELVIEQQILDDAVKLANKWQNEKTVEAIVARGPTALMLEKAVDLPLSTVKISSFDLMKTFHKARIAYGTPIGFLSHKNSYQKYDFAIFREMLNLDVKVYQYGNEAELAGLLECACSEGVKAMISTGSCIILKTGNLDINPVFVHSSEESIREAIATVVRLVEIKRENSLFTERLSTILNSIHDGVLALDEKGTVFFYNPMAEKLLGLRQEEIIGNSIGQLKNCREIESLYHNGRKVTGEIVKLAGKELVVNRMLIRMSGGSQCVVLTFQGVSSIRQMEGKIRQKLHSKGLLAKYHLTDIVGKSPSLVEAITQAQKYARTQSTVLISGESGTGKELFAQSIHNESERRQGPFVAVNCAALPENLLESELFGYEEGAFTGARRGGKLGLFELAHSGTIFMDEIGELGSHLQARLLRVIQQKEVMRVGGDRVVPVDTRIITATNRNLLEAVQKGHFREDLYYRLNVLPLKVPALRERAKDVPLLFSHFVKGKGRNIISGDIPRKIVSRLMEYDWPGNVRELENFAERYIALGEEDPVNFITLQDLINRMLNSLDKGPSKKQITVEIGTFEEIENSILDQLAKASPYTRQNLAKALGISRTTLWRKLKSPSGAVN
ncbi:MAG: sigma 54-interacting transcriptional regulator [Bacillota bacterium]